MYVYPYVYLSILITNSRFIQFIKFYIIFNSKLCFRWSSYYDAIKCIVDNLNKIDEVFSITSLSSLSRPRETTFLIEYCKVYKIFIIINLFLFYFKYVEMYSKIQWNLNNSNWLGVKKIRVIDNFT